ncbi:MAG: HDOD domain-containing protein [Clostridia bacterium]|nr:HDOD domain-containing protein [Clostridia bacterium]
MEVFVARQPIFDKNKQIYGYELLYRKNSNNFFDNTVDGNIASASVIIDSFLVIGLQTLTGGNKAFVNFTSSLIKQEVSTIFPKDQLVVEILETIEPDDEIISSCRRLKEQGFIIALDDFVFKEQYEPLIELADIIKIDFLSTSEFDKKNIVQRYRHKNIKFLAEKIETYEDFEKAVSLGYTYFQGYFFSKPVIMSAKDIAPNKLNCIQLVKQVNEMEPDFRKMSSIIGKDVALSYALLKLVNSAAFYHVNKINSIDHALAMLGLVEIKKWIYLVVLRRMAEDKPTELVRYCLIRAKFCELLACELGMRERSSELFMMGLFSLIDVLMDRPLQELLTDLPLSEDIRRALVGEAGKFRDIYEIIIAFEKADWIRVWAFSKNFKLNMDCIAKNYYSAVEWANKCFPE